MFWLQCFAGLWMAYSAYRAYDVMDEGQRLARVDDMVAEVEEQKIVLEMMPLETLLGVLSVFQVLLVGFDLLGLALAHEHLAMQGWRIWAFSVIVGCWLAEMTQSFWRIRKFQRLCDKDGDPFPIIARYCRYCVLKESPLTYISVYGKCFASVNLFLGVI